MIGSIWAVLTSIPAIISAVKQIIGIGWAIVHLFDKDPVAEQAKQEADHQEAERKAATEDDTSGSFGG